MEGKYLTQILEDMVEDFCSHYCKWPDLWDEEVEGKPLEESEHCEQCPLLAKYSKGE